MVNVIDEKDKVVENDHFNAAEGEIAAKKIQAWYRGRLVRMKKIETKGITEWNEIEDKAATKIQAVFRGHKVRNLKPVFDFDPIKSEQAAKKIQSAFRKFRKPDSTFQYDKTAAAIKIQSLFRGHQIRLKKRIDLANFTLPMWSSVDDDGEALVMFNTDMIKDVRGDDEGNLRKRREFIEKLRILICEVEAEKKFSKKMYDDLVTEVKYKKRY